MPDKNLLIILGATASGKTNLAIHLAGNLNGEIISADSRQVFRGMDVGTGKDLTEYTFNDVAVPYHLIDIKEPGESYQVDSFKNNFYTAFEDINSRGKFPILCGGSGMYIHSVLQNHELTAVPVNVVLRDYLQHLSKSLLKEKLGTYPKELTAHVDKSSTKRLIRAIEIAEFLTYNELKKEVRPTINPLVIGLYNEVEIRREKIISRLNYRISKGLIGEVEQLIAQGVSQEVLEFYGLEYKFVVAYLKGVFTLEELREKLGIAICQYAKRQMTFFRKMEKDGVVINWIKAIEDKALLYANVLKLVEQEFDLK